MSTERAFVAPDIYRDGDIAKVMSWFQNNEVVLNPVARNVRNYLDVLYKKLGGKNESLFRKDTLIEKARDLLEEVIDLSINGGEVEPHIKLAADYAVTGESKLIDILLEGKSEKYVRPARALARLVHVARGNIGAEYFHIPAAALLIDQEIIESEQRPQ